MNECDCPQCNTEQLAFETGRQAEYKLHRAGTCKHVSECVSHGFTDGRVCAHVKFYLKPCPTDYRECPLKETDK